MTNKKNFFKWAALLLCLLTLCLSSSRPANAQKEQASEGRQEGRTDDGYVIIEGDIQVSPRFASDLRATRLTQGVSVPTNTQLWPGGIVPFEFDSNVSAANQTLMLNAMAVPEGIAKVDFQQCASNTCTGNFVHVQGSTVNNSWVGVMGGRQVINITTWNQQFVIVHELLHCLGFYHEQSSPNSVAFVTINCANIQGDTGDCQSTTAQANFRQIDDASVYGYYDYDSLMHYDRCAFSKDCAAGTSCRPCIRPTITTNDPEWQNKIGQRTHVSSLDEATLARLYPPTNSRFVDQLYDGSNGPPDGSPKKPYRDLATGIANTPKYGTLWIHPGVYTGFFNKTIAFKAPLGDVEVR